MYLTLIYDYFNVLIRIKERNSESKANQAGKFYTKRGGWYQVVRPENSTEVEMWYSLLNM